MNVTRPPVTSLPGYSVSFQLFVNVGVLSNYASVKRSEDEFSIGSAHLYLRVSLCLYVRTYMCLCVYLDKSCV